MRVLIISFLLFFSSVCIPSCFVRVLLEKKEIEDGILWTLQAEDSVIVYDIQEKKKPLSLADTKLVISLKKGKIYINDMPFQSHALFLRPRQGTVRCDSKIYQGSFLIVLEDKAVHLINRIELENYVSCGVAWEMIPTWPDAALEAGAIVYRTYVISQLRAVRAKYRRLNKKEWFDVHCTPLNQVYKGMHKSPRVYEAVKKTAGQILTYKGEPIIALHDMCCGGTIPAGRTGIDFKKAPYLARALPCHYCNDCSFYHWQLLIPLPDVISYIANKVEPVSLIKSLKITKRDASHYVHEIEVNTGKKIIKIPGTQIQWLFPGIKSNTFVVENDKNKLLVKGKGYGHQLGLCQWGAYGCAKLGWDYLSIVYFYYPGTRIKKIQEA